MKNKGNNGAVLVTHDAHPEYGVGVLHSGCNEELIFEEDDSMVYVDFVGMFGYNAYVYNLSLLES